MYRNTFFSKILNNKDFALTPYNPTPSLDDVILFNKFIECDKIIIWDDLFADFSHYDESQIQTLVTTIHHFKGPIEHVSKYITFEMVHHIQHVLSYEISPKYQFKFVNEIIDSFLNGDFILSSELIEYLFETNIEKYMLVVKKLNLCGISKKIFNHNPQNIFTWLNICDDVYSELVELNEPEYIFKNMSGKLNVSDGCFKYILEKSEPNIKLFLSIKKVIGLKKFWELAPDQVKNLMLSTDFIENIDDLIFTINIQGISNDTLEKVLKTTKDRFPHIYESLDSLMFVKKYFNNK